MTRPGSRYTFWRRIGAVAGIWVVATVVVLVIAAETKLGPIVLVLSRRHGVHAGDVLALVLAYAAAGMLTRLLLLRGRI